jgi:hypothetical protein
MAITVTAVDDSAATVVNNTITVAEGDLNTVLTTMELSATDADTTDATLIYTVGNVTNGTLTINGSVWASGTNDIFTQQNIIDGNILYSHDDSNTTSDSFSFSVGDSINTLAGQTMAITVTAVDDDTATVVYNALTVIEGDLNTVLTTSELSATDTDSTDTTLIYTVGDVTNGALTINGSAWSSGTNDSFTQQNIIDGNILYSHDDSNTTSDSFSFSVDDGTNTLAGQTMAITVTAVDDSTPTVVNNALTVAEGDVNTVLTTAELSATDADSTDATLIYTVGSVTNGTLTINGSIWASGTNDSFTQQNIIDGNILYSHDDSNTTSDSISFSVGDGTNTPASQTMGITVIAVDDDTSTVINNALTVIEGDLNTVLTTSELSATDIDSTDATLIFTVGNVSNGTLTINGSAWSSGTNDSFTQQNIIDGNILYSHDDSNTSSDGFSFSVGDATNTLAGQTMAITVNAVDDSAATVVNNALTVVEGDLNTVLTSSELSATDADSTDMTLIYTVGDVTNGALTINGSAWSSGTNDSFTQQDIIDGNILYSHDDSNTAGDSFIFSVGDGTNTLAGQTMVITVTAVDDSTATVVNNAITVTEGDVNTVLTVADLLATDTDTTNTTLTYTVGNVINGSLTINGSGWASSSNDSFTQQDIIDGNIFYTHNDSNTNSDRLSFSVGDGTNTLAGQTMVITVIAVDDSTATVVNNVLTVTEGDLNTVFTVADLSASDTDTNDSTLIYTVGNVTNGTLTINGSVWASGTNDTFTQQNIIDGNILYSHDNSNTSSDSFSFSISDNSGNRVSNQTITIAVNPVFYEAIDDDDDDQTADVENEDDNPDEEDNTDEGKIDNNAEVNTPDKVINFNLALNFDEPGNALSFAASNIAPVGPNTATHTPSMNYLGKNVAVEEITLENAARGDFQNSDLLQKNVLKKTSGQLISLDLFSTDSLSIISIKSISISGVSLSAGYVAWLLRGGALVSSLISTRPLWGTYDPLPIVNYAVNKKGPPISHQSPVIDAGDIDNYFS